MEIDRNAKYISEYFLTGLKIIHHHTPLKKPGAIALAYHPQYEVVFYKKIKGSVKIYENNTELRNFSALYLPPHFPHEFVVQPPGYDFIALQVSPELVNVLLEGRVPLAPYVADLDREDFQNAWTIAEMLMNRYNHQSNNIRSDMTKLLFTMIIDQAPKDLATHFSTEMFNKLIHYMDTNEKYSLSGEEAARYLGLSRSHFLRKFKESFGKTYNRFIINRKIEKAKNTLVVSEKSIKYIALELEFSSSAYFCRVFRQEVGVTPDEFRKGMGR